MVFLALLMTYVSFLADLTTILQSGLLTTIGARLLHLLSMVDNRLTLLEILWSVDNRRAQSLLAKAIRLYFRTVLALKNTIGRSKATSTQSLQ